MPRRTKSSRYQQRHAIDRLDDIEQHLETLDYIVADSRGADYVARIRRAVDALPARIPATGRGHPCWPLKVSTDPCS
jgi:hypothetical protein